MSRPSLAAETAAAIAERINCRPKVAVVLGSGLGEFADQLADTTTIAYSDLPGFCTSTVAGHGATLVAGQCGTSTVICLSGRSHIYEGVTASAIATPIRALKLLGVEKLLLTNASGSVRPHLLPGTLVSIRDHINLQGFNPLVGPNDDSFGPRFVNMGNAYSAQIRSELQYAAQALGTPLPEGTYLASSGPTFETPAEVNAFRILGADLLGMSTVAEVIVARHCNLPVAAVSVVTNLAEGLSDVELSHDQTLVGAAMGAGKLVALLQQWLSNETVGLRWTDSSVTA